MFVAEYKQIETCTLSEQGSLGSYKHGKLGKENMVGNRLRVGLEQIWRGLEQTMKNWIPKGPFC